MTVAELIAVLQALDQDMPVMTENRWYDCDEWYEHGANVRVLQVCERSSGGGEFDEHEDDHQTHMLNCTGPLTACIIE